MTDDYFMIPRIDRRKTLIFNGLAISFALGSLTASVTGLGDPLIGVEASLCIVAVAGCNVVLRLVTRKPVWPEPWERRLAELQDEPQGADVREAMAAAEAGDLYEFDPPTHHRATGRLLQEHYDDHVKRNEQNASNIRDYMNGRDHVELPLDESESVR